MKLLKRITEIYDTDEDDLAAVDGVVIGDLGDPEPEDEPGEDDAEEPEEEAEEPHSRTRSMPKPKRRGR